MKVEMGGLRNAERKQPGLDLADVLKELGNESFEGGPGAIAKSPRMYTLAQTTTPAKLESLSELNFENTMIEIGGKLILATGGKKSSAPNYHDHYMSMAMSTDMSDQAMPVLKEVHKLRAEQMRASRFVLHNHPSATFPGFLGADVAVSDADIQSTGKSEGEIFFIVSDKGIVGYEKHQLMPTFGLPSFVLPSRTEVNGFEGSNNILAKQKEKGVTRFFVPFRGDEESQRKLEVICQYINDPSMKWESIKGEVED